MVNQKKTKNSKQPVASSTNSDTFASFPLKLKGSPKFNEIVSVKIIKRDGDTAIVETLDGQILTINKRELLPPNPVEHIRVHDLVMIPRTKGGYSKGHVTEIFKDGGVRVVFDENGTSYKKVVSAHELKSNPLYKKFHPIVREKLMPLHPVRLNGVDMKISRPFKEKGSDRVFFLVETNMDGQNNDKYFLYVKLAGFFSIIT